MSLKTLTITNPPVNQWFDWVVPGEKSLAVVDMNIFNRGWDTSIFAMALADKNRVEMSSPTGLTATKEGLHSGGVNSYSYRVSAVDDSGETLASSAVLIENCLNDFTDTDYVSLSWNAISGANKYRVYGRTSGTEQLLVEVETNAYNDKMEDYLGGNSALYNTTQLKARLWEGELSAKTALEVTGRKFLLDSNTKIIAYVDENYVDLVAFGADA